ncbi:MAG: hypothetical protein U0800_11110 [Isosphaeraceae bacterium]
MYPDIAAIRRLGEQVKGFLRERLRAESIQDDWDPEILQIGLRLILWIGHHLRRDPPRRGRPDERLALRHAATTIRERDRLIPVLFKLRPDERARMEELMTMNVAAGKGVRVPLDQISEFRPEFVPPKIGRATTSGA